MSSTTSNEISRWLGRPLCRRYAYVQLRGFQAPAFEKGMLSQQRWWWGFAMFAADEFEIMGAWRADEFAHESIVKDLRNRGVQSIRVVSIAEVKGCASLLSPEDWATGLHDATPRVLEVVASQAVSGDAIEGVPSQAIRSALNKAGRIHGSLVRGARRRAPFASAEAATEFVASWLQTTDRCLYEGRRSTRTLVARAA